MCVGRGEVVIIMNFICLGSSGLPYFVGACIMVRIEIL